MLESYNKVKNKRKKRKERLTKCYYKRGFTTDVVKEPVPNALILSFIDLQSLWEFPEEVSSVGGNTYSE